MPKILKRLLIAVAIAAALIAVVAPIPTLRMHRRFLQFSPAADAPNRRLLDTDGRVPMASWMPAPDTSLGLADAGLALRRLFPFNAVGTERSYVRELEPLPMLWESATPDTALFPDARANNDPRAMFDRNRVFRSVRRGLTAEERAYAGNVADDSLWRVFDRAAHAVGADLVAASFIAPLAMDIAHFEMPIPRISRISALSDGVAMRAALFAAAGQRDSADAVIGRLYAIGVLLHRDGLNTMEGLLGRRAAMNAIAMRRSLHETFPGPTSPAVLAALDSVRWRDSSATQAARTRSESAASAQSAAPAALRARDIRALQSPSVARAYRFEALGVLSMSACADLGSLLFGPDADVTAAQAAAMQSMPRTAAESAYVALLVHQVDSARFRALNPSGLARAFRASNRALAAITFNPRLRVCADIASSAAAM